MQYDLVEITNPADFHRVFRFENKLQKAGW